MTFSIMVLASTNAVCLLRLILYYFIMGLENVGHVFSYNRFEVV